MVEILRNQSKQLPITVFKQMDKKDEHGFWGKCGEVYGLEHDAIKLGIGSTNTTKSRIQAGYTLGGALKKKQIEFISFEFEKADDLDVIEGLVRSFYSFDKYKTDSKKNKLQLNVITDDTALLKQLDELENVLEGLHLAIDVVNEPSNTIYPESLADFVTERLGKSGVEVTVYDQSEILELGMHAYLSVARGSQKEPKLIVMKWMNNPESDDVLGIVGKGVTYDSGGYSLKPSASMKTMFTDMGGAGTTIGTIDTIARLNLKVNVIGVIAATENMISGDAYKPGDIITSMSKKSIEVDNTDAEGRLTLADALYYITQEHPVTKVIDLATLTGACVVALGETFTGAITNDSHFMQDVLEAAKEVDEYIWELPNDESFKELNKSEVADIKNSGGRAGGAVTAGLFVGEFLARDIPWVHLDIAGTAYLSKGIGYRGRGATGVHVKTLVNLIKKQA